MALVPYALTRPFLFGLDAEKAHDLTLGAIARLQNTPAQRLWQQPRIADPIKLAGLTFPNRIGLAAGLDKNGRCIDGLGAMGFGFIEVGTVTPKAQPGNPRPRIFRLPQADALINRLGFNNEGLAAFIAHVEQAHSFRASGGVLGLNIGKNAATPIENAVDDYLLGLDGVYPHADYVTVNISSPNTRNLRSLQSDEALDALLSALNARREKLARKHRREVPIFLKRSANRPPFAYLPFAAGPRLCIGNQFALTEAQLVLATIAQRYQLRLTPGHPVAPDPVFTLRTSHGLPMTVQRRAVTALILFDLDGVLVDSEPISTAVLVHMLAEAGQPMSAAAAEELFMGRSRAEAIRWIEQRNGQAVPADFVDRWQARVFEAFRRELRPVPGIEAALGQLTIPTCVASGSDPDRIQLSLELAGLLPRFAGRIFSATQVPRGKPAPDLFLFAARSLGAAPDACVVVEDSVPGVQAGVAAGMVVLGYAARNSAALLAQAGAITFTDMAQLPVLMAERF